MLVEVPIYEFFFIKQPLHIVLIEKPRGREHFVNTLAERMRAGS
jgi:hypothetical protein